MISLNHMKKFIALGFAGFAPLLASAQVSTVDTILMQVIGWLNYIVPALVTLAVVYFIWGVITFISSSDEEAKKNGRAKIINGLIGLFVIVAFWGIIGLVQRTFGVDSQTMTGVAPCVPTTANNMGRNC
ncbi:MAG: hypothetical protein US04_C0001G0245 [Candidatus Nomurabacteria bacterium GW2011_GWD2_36_14]|nr:MAG: hypothetical protein UR97_C0003G0003 [Candidatus Nomurabacteria bacterium GW2011_GWE2_36_115]KKP94129.1 MAG: hypothetical protein US00_C0003G0053 [Candidatus Nomurabacteria bacterium GW2011_GWF2_36_126]KKP96743.1 MAG: hypothetical protein US04_C0001G0245 [Candidatus Nomurabacteria bacterium GW2011_GWD2_36_14]KKP99653.1 MAG: hypothetical protein US08_C0001G0336 [Candidatus Nomurabacteria bacterium GW2011_GWF2_36_19]KKQ05431.1 MAG: hypothetical protein US17_C0004G0003 [Candidatus Nomuraba